MTSPDPDRSLIGRIGAHTMWANCTDPSANGAHGQRGLVDRLTREVDPDGTLTPAERARRVEAARKAHMLALARKSAETRRKRAAQRKTARPDYAATAAELRAQREQGRTA